MNADELKQPRELVHLLRSVRWWVRALTVAVLLMTLALLLTVATVFGYLVEYHASEAMLRGAVAVAVAVLGFGFGLLAGCLWRRK